MNVLQNPEILLVGIYQEKWKHMSLHKDMHLDVHSSISPNSQKVKTTTVSINWWTSNQRTHTHTHTHTHSGRPFNNKQEWNTGKCYNMDKNLEKLCSMKEAIHKRLYIKWFHSYEMSGKGKSIETGMKDLTRWWKCSTTELWWWLLHNWVNLRKITELYFKMSVFYIT